MLELRADVNQLSTYELKVAASAGVLDGFQQPLLAGAVTEYTAAGTSLLTSFGESFVEKDFANDWAFVHRQQGGAMQQLSPGYYAILALRKHYQRVISGLFLLGLQASARRRRRASMPSTSTQRTC